MYHLLQTHTGIRRVTLLSDIGIAGEINDKKKGQFTIKQEFLGNICGLLKWEQQWSGERWPELQERIRGPQRGPLCNGVWSWLVLAPES